MTQYDRALAALAEVNPPVAAGLRAAGAPGHLGWLPKADLLDLARAWFIGAGNQPLPEELTCFVAMSRAQVWRRPRGPCDIAATHEAVLAWATTAGHDGARRLVEVLAVHEGIHL